MTTAIFVLDAGNKQLTPLPQRSMADLSLSESYDLEAWLATSSDGLFGRQVIWIMRQDRPSNEQRSDLVGVDKAGDLLVAELKKGEVGEEAITQALGYAAEYADKTAEDLAAMFAAHSMKGGSTGLVAKATSLEDAKAKLSAHVGDQIEPNESQVLLLVGESFTAKALAICDYLNRAAGDPTFFIECWRYAIYQGAGGAHYFLLEQVLPPPNVRVEIEEKREAAIARKYARDPRKVEFMYALLDHLASSPTVEARRNRGQSYECRITSRSWSNDHDLWFSVNWQTPRLFLPAGLRFDGDPSEYGAIGGTHGDGRQTLEFHDVDMRTAKFDRAFGDRLIQLVGALKVVTTAPTPATTTA